MNENKPWRRWIDGWLLLILLLATILRMVHIGVYPTVLDELLMLDSAMQLARHGQWTWIGNPTSFAPIPAHSPLTIYLTAIPLFFSPDWMLARYWIAILGVVAVGGMYFLLRRYAGQYAAIVGATLIAVMPFPVDWSRFVWNPNFAPPFFVFWLLTGLLGYYEGNHRAQIAHWLLLSAIIQTDAAYIILTPLSLLLTIYGYWQNGRTRRYALTQDNTFIRTMLIAWCMTAVTLLPMLNGNIGVRQGNFTYDIHVVPERNPAIHLQLPDLKQMADTFGLLVASAGFRQSIALTDDAEWWYPDARLHVLFWAQAGIVFVGMLWGLAAGLRRRANFPLLWLTLATVSPLGFYFIDSGHPILPYFLMLTPFASVALFAMIFARLWAWKRIMGLIVWLFIAAQLWLTVANLHHSQQHKNLNSPAVLENLVADWASQGEVVIIQDEAITPVEQEWLLRWRILAERYPIGTIASLAEFSPSSEAVVLVSDAPLPAELGASEVYPLPDGNLYFVFISPPQ